MVKSSTFVIIPSISRLDRLKTSGVLHSEEIEQIVVIDEGEPRIRGHNVELLANFPATFYGPVERREWFRDRFGGRWRRYAAIVPRQCHAESTFGFLLAYELSSDFVVELDDDVSPVAGSAYVSKMIRKLDRQRAWVPIQDSNFYNTLENLVLEPRVHLYPRGHPFFARTPNESIRWVQETFSSVGHMSLWLGDPDLDAFTIGGRGGYDGLCDVKSVGIVKDRVVPPRGRFFCLCSMAAIFKSDVIPAFYQLFMNSGGLDRYDDIWSGLFLEKVCYALGDRLSLGEPSVVHSKRARNLSVDLGKEASGYHLNEYFGSIIPSLRVTGSDYWDTYRNLISTLEIESTDALPPSSRALLKQQLGKMITWLEVIDQIR